MSSWGAANRAGCECALDNEKRSHFHQVGGAPIRKVAGVRNIAKSWLHVLVAQARNPDSTPATLRRAAAIPPRLESQVCPHPNVGLIGSYWSFLFSSPLKLQFIETTRPSSFGTSISASTNSKSRNFEISQAGVIGSYRFFLSSCEFCQTKKLIQLEMTYNTLSPQLFPLSLPRDIYQAWINRR